jgi:hypothetical protein
MRLVLLACLIGAAFLAPPAAAEERCSAIVGQTGSITYEPLPGYSILAQTPPYSPPATQAGPLRGISCLRDTLTLAPNDYRVITDMHVPFLVSAYYTDDEDRILLLDVADGVVSARIIDGRLTPQERADLERAVAQMQSAVDALGDPH